MENYTKYIKYKIEPCDDAEARVTIDGGEHFISVRINDAYYEVFLVSYKIDEYGLQDLDFKITDYHAYSDREEVLENMIYDMLEKYLVKEHLNFCLGDSRLWNQ